jgi:hypothetical protein
MNVMRGCQVGAWLWPRLAPGRATAVTTEAPAYPVRYRVDYPERLNRLTTLLRLLWIIPIGIVLMAVSGGARAGGTDGDGVSIVAGAGGVLIFGPLLMILFRQKYPRWWFDWNFALSRFSARVGAYAALLRDEYPSTDEEQAVHLDIDYPDVPRDLNRWLPLVKWLLALPHYVVLFFLAIAAIVAIVVAWFAILFTGRYPRDLFNFVVGFGRWVYRVNGYAFLLVTDRYPPFRLGE